MYKIYRHLSAQALSLTWIYNLLNVVLGFRSRLKWILEYGGEEVEDIPRYVLIGFGAKAVLTLVVPDCVIIYSIEEIDDMCR